MSRPYSIKEAHIIFDGHFRTSPVGLVEKYLGDGNWRMICHLSKLDKYGCSMNDWIDSADFPTSYFPAATVASYVSPSFGSLSPHIPSYKLRWYTCMIGDVVCTCRVRVYDIVAPGLHLSLVVYVSPSPRSAPVCMTVYVGNAPGLHVSLTVYVGTSPRSALVLDSVCRHHVLSDASIKHV